MMTVMGAESSADRRLKFYGLNDYGTYFQVERAATILEGFDSAPTERTASDVLELYNVQRFIESNLYPASYTDDQRAACQALVPELRKTVGKFFNSLGETNIASVVADIGFEYHGDLLELFAKYKVFERCSAGTALPLLKRVGVQLGEMLRSQSLVRSYGQEIRAILLSDATNAVYLIRKYLEDDADRAMYLPSSLTTADARSLINQYIEGDDPSPNLVELVSLARVDAKTGIDAKTKLKAKRKHDEQVKEFFSQNSGVRTGCEVAIVDGQVEPAEGSLHGLVARYSYSQQWLEDTLDNPSILNNFIYIFEFADWRMLLTFPSYQKQLGALERVIMTTGKEGYPAGSTFRLKEQRSLLDVVAYNRFLTSKKLDLESVIAWFFAQYLKDEFDASNFRFVPSSKASTYLEKCRHLFAEMESVAKQFTLYVENGELDTGLLGIASEQVWYAGIPSLMAGKYVYPADDQDIRNILHLLFSDQSGLAYISEALRATDAATLLRDNQISYDHFADHQKPQIDYLIQQGVLENDEQCVQFASDSQLLVLRQLSDSEAASYYSYLTKTRAAIDEMVGRGWLVRRETLLTAPESGYFNYCLNQAEFSNGPDLRNKYLHGSHADASDENEHYRTYITALKLLIALVIKINDDLWLRHDEGT